MALNEHDKALESDLKAKFGALKGSLSVSPYDLSFRQIRQSRCYFIHPRWSRRSRCPRLGRDASTNVFALCGGQKIQSHLIDESRGGKAGIKSVVNKNIGPYAYGYFKSEAGVHRLGYARSPFNSTHTRETSICIS